MAEIFDLSVTDASNTARFPENQAASTVNNGMRATEGMVARHHKDVDDAMLATAGTDTAYTIAAPNRTIASYHDGMTIRAQMNATCGATPTLNVESVGAQSIVWNDGSNTAVTTGDLVAGSIVTFVYDLGNTDWVVVSAVTDQNLPASTSAAGIAELATTGETATGTDEARVVTPNGLHDMTTLSGAAWFLDQDDMSGNSAVKVASQQSIKAYADSLVVSQADQAAMEAETNENTYVPPDLVRNSPGVCKVWASVDRTAGTPSLDSPSYNVTSVADAGAAGTTITIATDFSTAVYPVFCQSFRGDDGASGIGDIVSQVAGSYVCHLASHAGADADTNDFFTAAFGDQ